MQPIASRQTDVFIAIADPSRRKILELLRGGERPAGWIADSFRISRPAVSQHLSVLRRVGLVRERRVGRERRYKLEPAPLREVMNWCKQYEVFWSHRLNALGRLLDHESD